MSTHSPNHISLSACDKDRKPDNRDGVDFAVAAVVAAVVVVAETKTPSDADAADALPELMSLLLLLLRMVLSSCSVQFGFDRRELNYYDGSIFFYSGLSIYADAKRAVEKRWG